MTIKKNLNVVVNEDKKPSNNVVVNVGMACSTSIRMSSVNIEARFATDICVITQSISMVVDFNPCLALFNYLAIIAGILLYI